MKRNEWRVGTVAVVVVAGLMLGGLAGPARAQDAPKFEDSPAGAEDLAAETAYLKAYFAEKEKRDFAVAESAYAAVATMAGAPREVVGRALLGRARCLKALQRGRELDALIAEIGEGYADVVTPADFAALRPPSVPSGDVASRVKALLESGSTSDVAEYGDRALPYLVPELRGDVPQRVRNAAEALRKIGSPAAWEALTQSLRDGSVPYPRQVSESAFVGDDFDSPKPFHLVALRAAFAHADPAVRLPALDRALNPEGAAPDDVIAAVIADPVHGPAVIDGDFSTGERWGQCLVAALVSGRPELRTRAVERMDGWGSEELHWNTAKYTRAFFDPPESLLADPEALRTVLDGVYRTTQAESAFPSRALVARLAQMPDGADLAATWMLVAQSAPSPFDVGAFAAALKRSRPGGKIVARNVVLRVRLAEVVSAADAGAARDAAVDAIAGFRAWSPLVPELLQDLEQRDALDAPTLRKLASSVSESSQRTGILHWLSKGGAARVVDASGIRVRDEILAAAIGDPDPKVAAAAISGLRALAQQSSVPITVPAASLRQFLEGKDDRLAEAAIAYLKSRGDEGVAELIAQLRPDHPRAQHLVGALAEAKDPRIDGLLREVLLRSPTDAARHAATTLARRAGSAAEPVFAEAIASDSSSVRQYALLTVAELARKLGPDATTRLLVLGFARAPGSLPLPAVSARSNNLVHEGQAQAQRQQVLGALTVEQQLEVLRAARRSTAASDRRWAAWAMAESVGDASWDDLIASAEDPDGEVREIARESLRTLEHSRSELERLRSAGAARGVRDRIDALLADAKPDSRRAAIAAVVATRGVDRIPELLRLAVDDEDEDVRTDARAALVALGSSGATAAPTRIAPVPDEK